MFSCRYTQDSAIIGLSRTDTDKIVQITLDLSGPPMFACVIRYIVDDMVDNTSLLGNDAICQAHSCKIRLIRMPFHYKEKQISIKQTEQKSLKVISIHATVVGKA